MGVGAIIFCVLGLGLYIFVFISDKKDDKRFRKLRDKPFTKEHQEMLTTVIKAQERVRLEKLEKEKRIREKYEEYCQRIKGYGRNSIPLEYKEWKSFNRRLGNLK